MSTMVNRYGNTLEPTVKALGQLSPQSQETIISLARQLAQREGDQRTINSILQFPDPNRENTEIR